jgi:hypothetical protein
MTVDDLREWRLMESLRDEPQCSGCGCDKGRLVLCWQDWHCYILSGMPLDEWLASLAYLGAGI